MEKNNSTQRKAIIFLLIVYLCLLVLVLIPIWTIEYLPLQDYPNHMARMHIISHIQNEPFLQKFYSVKFSILPNLAMDIIVPALDKVFSLEVAGRLMISLIFLTFTSGSIFLNYALFKTINFLPLMSLLLIFNQALIKGFLNFLFGVGIALWCIGLWVLMRKKKPWLRITLFTILSIVLFFCHLYAFGFYGIVIGCYQIVIILNKKNISLKKILLESIIIVSQFVVPTALYFISPSSNSHTNYAYSSIPEKFYSYPLFLFSNYDSSLDKANFLFLIIVIVFFGIRKKLRISNLTILPIFVLIVLYFFLPRNLSTGANTDWRLLIPLSLLIFSSIELLSDRKIFTIMISSVLAILLTLNIYAIERKWMSFQDEYREIMTLLENVEVGSRLFFTRTFTSYQKECYPFMHAPAYAIIRKSAFIPSLFAFGTQQPVRFNEEPISVIRATPDSPTCPKYPEPIYREVNWETIIQQYNYILVGGEEHFKNIPTSFLNKISTGKNYVLYQTKL